MVPKKGLYLLAEAKVRLKRNGRNLSKISTHLICVQQYVIPDASNSAQLDFKKPFVQIGARRLFDGNDRSDRILNVAGVTGVAE